MTEAWGILWGEDAERLARLAVRELRAPRVALAILSGAALGLAGAMMQDGLRNPLAGPELLGVASGASLVVAVVTLFQVPLLLWCFIPGWRSRAACSRGPWLSSGRGEREAHCR